MVFTFNCNMCNYRCETTTNAIYFSHLTVYHRLTTRFLIQCQVPHCGRVFSSYLSFKRHWYKYRHNNGLCNTINQQDAQGLAGKKIGII